MELTGLHLLLSYACTWECDHCFVHSSPRAGGTMTLAQIEDALRQAAELGTVTDIWIEGGEPFLFHPLLLATVIRAKALGFTVGAVTNAYYATSEEDALLWLRPLAEAGIDSLAVSEDDYHGTGPAGRTRAAAESLGLDCGVICIEPPCVRDDEHEPGEPILGGGVRFRGRAAERVDASGLPRRPWREFTRCPDEDWERIGRLHLDGHGNLWPCQGVVLGNLERESLADIVRGYDPDGHPVIGPLKRGGPAALAEAHGFDAEPEYLDACQLCYRVRQCLRPRLPEALAPPLVYGVED